MTSVERFIGQIPPPDEIRREIVRTIRERKLLERLLQLAEQRERVEAVSDRRERQTAGA